MLCAQGSVSKVGAWGNLARVDSELNSLSLFRQSGLILNWRSCFSTGLVTCLLIYLIYSFLHFLFLQVVFYLLSYYYNCYLVIIIIIIIIIFIILLFISCIVFYLQNP